MTHLPRLLCFSLALAVVCELLVLLPMLTAERRAWLQQQFLTTQTDTPTPAVAHHINLSTETDAEALQATLRDLLWRTAEPLAVTGPTGADTTRTLVLNTLPLGNDLRHAFGPAALTALPAALATALLAFASLALLLRQPSPPAPAAAQPEPPPAATIVARLSHDLRGILSPALLSAERLQSNPDPKIRATGDLIAEVVDRATILVKQALDAVRPPAPHGPVVLLDALAGLPIALQAPRDFILTADPAALHRILEQFAHTATAAGATIIALSARMAGDTATLTLTDNRHGQAQPGPAQELARAQGGNIILAESSFGSTVFRLTLPQPRPENRSALDRSA